MKWWQKVLDFFRWRQNIVKHHWTNHWTWIGAKVYMAINSTLVVFNFVLAFLIIKNVSQSIVILHYNVIFGNDYIGEPWRIILLPIVGFSISLINYISSVTWLNHDKLLSHMTLITAVCANILIGLGLYSIYMINFVNIKF
jgi:hypothetical protein